MEMAGVDLVMAAYLEKSNTAGGFIGNQEEVGRELRVLKSA